MLKRFLNDENGQGMVEYGLIIALVAVAVIAAIVALSGNIGNIFNKAGEKLSSAAAGA
jgi:pilus assembly protein Flp/PilA